MSLQSNYYPVPIVAGTTAGTYAAGDDSRLSDERTPPNDAVTNAKLANVDTATIKGRATAGTGDPEDLSASQVRTILNVADGAEVNVQANWTEADSGSDAFILNKPTLGTAASQDTSAFAAASHTHGNLSNDGKIGSTSGLPLKTGTDGVVEAGAFGTGAGEFCAGDDARLSDARTPSTHASTHAAGGSDAIAPSDIGAQSIFENIAVGPISADTTLTASRAARYNILNFSGARNVTLPTANVQAGDVAIVSSPASNGDITIRRSDGVGGFVALATIVTSGGAGDLFRFYSTTATGADWFVDRVSNHASNHGSGGADALSLAASQITSGTLAHERGGLEADVSAYNGLVKIASGSTSAVTVTSAGEALLDDVDAAAQRTTLGLGTAAVEDSTAFAAPADIPDASTATPQALGSAAAGTSDDYSRADHVHGAPALNDLSNVSAAAPSDNDVLVYDNATSTWVAEAPAAGGVSAIGTSAADVLSVSGSDLVADDGGTVDSADPFIKWDDTAGKLVYANPLSRPSGAFYVGLAPTTTSLGTNAINIQAARTAGNQVAGGANGVVVGNQLRCEGSASIGIGFAGTSQNNSNCTGVGATHQCYAADTTAIGAGATCNSTKSTAIGFGATARGRGSFATLPFDAFYWGGQTTDATPTILNLDATATNRFTISANTALAVDILLVARRSDTADKWLVARRFLGIRRDGSNNTSLIGSVQTLGTDQNDGSPTWSFTLTADDTNEALQLEVTGAASETVQWRATAFYRVV